MSRSALSLATSFFRAAISASSRRCWPLPGTAVAGATVASRIHRRSTLSASSRSRHAWATVTPRSVTSFTASSLTSRLNFRLVISNLQFHGHDLIFVSTEPAAGHLDPKVMQASEANRTGYPSDIIEKATAVFRNCARQSSPMASRRPFLTQAAFEASIYSNASSTTSKVPVTGMPCDRSISPP